MDPTRGAFGEYGLPIAIIVVVIVLGRWAWRRLQRSPKWVLKRAVEKARKVNEQVRVEDLPHPVPEMEAARRHVVGMPDDQFEPESPRLRRRPTEASDDDHEAMLDARSAEAMARLRILEDNTDPKDPRMDYRRLDAFVRRCLFEFYEVRAFGETSSSVLSTLPESLPSHVIDTVGEILRVCELAELPRHRPTRSELRDLHSLAAEMIDAHARALQRR